MCGFYLFVKTFRLNSNVTHFDQGYNSIKYGIERLISSMGSIRCPSSPSYQECAKNSFASCFLCLMYVLNVYSRFSQMYQQLRLQVVNEARANFLAALHNLQATQSILSHVTFPYCLPPEVQTLQIAVSYIYTDMLTNKRYQHAFECYRSIHLRSAALLQWFDKVKSYSEVQSC